MRNVLIYQVAREMGWWAPRTQFCEVVLNGEYVGVFVFMEKLKKDKRNLQVLGDREGAALIQDHIDLVEAQRYIPLSFQNTGYLEVGGAVRSTAQPFAQFGRELSGSIVENKEFDVTEFITLMKGMGYGQSEISKTVALFERIQNSIYEKDQRKRERDEKNGKKENKSNVNSFKTDFEFQIK